MTSKRYTWRGFFLLFVVAAAWPLPGQENRGRKYALLIGVKRYDNADFPDLRFPENDAADLGKVLEAGGFKRVVLMTQTEGAKDRRYMPVAVNIRRELDGFLGGKNRDDTVLIGLAGHGITLKKDKTPCFCPMDADLKDPRTLIPIADIYSALKKSRAGIKLVLVDACREQVFRARPEVELESVTRPQGIQPPSGVAVLFSCMEGQKAIECPEFKHGLFFHFVIEGLRGKAANKKGVVSLKGLEKYLEDQVYDYAWEKYRHRQEFSSKGEMEGSIPLLNVSILPATAVMPSPARSPFKAEKAKALQEAWARSLGRKVEEALDLGDITMRLVLIPPGTFSMGSPENENGHYPFERQHEVTLTRPFAMAIHEVTLGQFRAFVEASGYRTQAETDGGGGGGLNPGANEFKWPDPKFTWRNVGFRQRDDEPVVNVSWRDAQQFCEWLSRTTKRRCRLPTEAEWEYACRAGTTTRFSCGDSDEEVKGVANLADGSFKQRLGYGDEDSWIVPWNDGYSFTAPVGSFRANAWGLFDMHGNVWEWTADWWSSDYPYGSVTDPIGPATGTQKVIRGGSYHNGTRNSRSAYRHGFDAPSYNVGFRVMADVP